MENYSALCNVPRPFPKESICSWLSRLGLSQGVSLWAMLVYLELKIFTDFDAQIGKMDLDSISKKTGLPISDFRYQRKFFKSLRKFDYESNSYVMRYRRKRRYRFCPLCLQEDEIPYFRIEWRLKLCISCPTHKCLLEENCHSCREPIVLPINLFTKVSDTRPLESLANCPSCGAQLTKINPAFFKDDLYEAMDLKSQYILEAGEQLIAAFYEGTYRFKKEMRDMKPFFNIQARKQKNKFKWTARTWRLKIKRHLKAHPSTSPTDHLSLPSP